MKIVNFTPGLGNQIFEYIFVQYLRKRYPKDKIYGYYNPKFLNQKHNGLEVHKVFDIEMPPSTWWSDVVAYGCRVIARIFHQVKSTDKFFSENSIYYDGWWQNKLYFLDTIKDLRFRNNELDIINKETLVQILSSEAVSIHVRRGDYLDPTNAKEYGGICTLDYYNKAISIVNRACSCPKYFIFSNDIDWCQKNLPISDAVFVKNNIGENSWVDMFLMSRCKINIIANSSFSYWGAMLNNNENQVIYPRIWNNIKTPDIFPEEWIAI